MVELRNRPVDSQPTTKKRKYTKRKRSSIITEIETETIELETETIETATIATETAELETETVEPKPKRCRSKYEKIETFTTEADVDSYIRLNNNHPLIVRNNDPVNCSVCHNLSGHSMKQIYKICSCKQCNLKYAIRCCLENNTEWLLFKSGVCLTKVTDNGLLKQAEIMDLDWEPDFSMQDACRASLNAIAKVQPSTVVLMCYFHVMDNIRKKKKLVKSERVYDELMDDLRDIHMSLNETEYETKKKEFKLKYEKLCKEMYQYINIQWFQGDFTLWQIFRRSPGYSCANSNIESFNATIKRDFTLRKRMNIKSALEKMNEIIIYYSVHRKEFMTKPKFNSKLKEIALNIPSKNFEKVSKYRIKYVGEKFDYIINLNEKTCSCRNYLKLAICHHLVAYSNQNKLNWFDSKYAVKDTNESDEKFVKKIKRGAKSGSYKRAEKAYHRDN